MEWRVADWRAAEGCRSGGKRLRFLLRQTVPLIGLLALVACDSPQGESAPAESPTNQAEGDPLEQGGEAVLRPRRIILISLDTVGAKHVAGYANADTPNLRKIALEGARFARFYAVSTYTLPSHMSMLTGLSPIEHGVVNFASGLSPKTQTLASILKDAGYLTRGFHEGGFVNPDFGFGRGFDDYEERGLKELAGVSIWGVLDWMREVGDAPYFLFVHTFIAHTPYRGFESARVQHPELGLPDAEQVAALKQQYDRRGATSDHVASREIPADTRHLCTLYNTISDQIGDYLDCGDRFIKEEFTTGTHFEGYRQAILESHRSEIRRGDSMVGKLRDLLREQGQWDDTLFIVSSDHGDGIFEHGTHGHDYSPFNEIIKVPLILSYPRRVPGSQVVDGLSWHLDLLPTILSFAQLPVPAELRGRDLSKVLLEGAKISPDRAIYPVLLRPAHRNHIPMRRMVLKGDLKYIEGHRHFGDPDGLLFDLAASPDEDENLRESNPAAFAELAALSRRYAASLHPGSPIHQETGDEISAFPGEVEPLELPEERKRELEALGYIFE